ncbi:hypothetical protein [Phreatobacter stygius]|uniref:Sulfur globule protein n=1 Tax=Phreatobacter stygius TaxID=1940610 RepID=A0A4D7BL77_9HYPH|nr:hypothetical protein [Phreatobacter stygius]QCI68487.1 hypothetical protein E8M01_32235 [Phreatobacter stygius]
MDRRSFFTILAGGVAAAAGVSTDARAAPISAEPLEMQWGWGGPGPYYGHGWGGPRPWRRRHYGYGYGPGFGPGFGPRPWGPPMYRRRCWINRWGERVCRF